MGVLSGLEGAKRWDEMGDSRVAERCRNSSDKEGEQGGRRIRGDLELVMKSYSINRRI